MAKTLCPSCGYSPIPDGTEECPACHHHFTFIPTYKRSPRLDRGVRALGDDEAGATIMGGTVFTSAVNVRPGPAIPVFIASAFAWLVRASGALGHGSPEWSYALVGLALLAALLLKLRRGPNKLFAQFVAIGMVLSALFLGMPDPVHAVPLLFALNGVAALVMVAGEPGTIRRWAGLGFGLATAIAAIVSLEFGDAAVSKLPALPGVLPSAPRQELVSKDYGFRLKLPSGYHLLTRDELNVFPANTEGNRTDVTVGAPGVIGRLSVVKQADPQLIGGCQAQRAALGGEEHPEPMAHSIPEALGGVALVYPLKLRGGAAGQIVCALLKDGRFVSLAVVALNGDPRLYEDAFSALGDGLTLQ